MNINEKAIVVTTGLNGGESTQVIPVGEFSNFDIGVDKNIRVICKSNARTFPVITLHEAPEDVFDLYSTALRAKEYK